MENINEILSKLNDEQIKPVLDTEGAVLVIAGAGSGKTRVLTSRIAYLILEKRVNPSEIMAITFTNKAAGEMKDRLEKLVGNIGDMWVSTIHSMCVRILRRDIDKIGYDRNFSIYDESDKEKLLKRVLNEQAYDVDKMLKKVKSCISSAKNECLTPDEYKTAYKDTKFIDEICLAYQSYENHLARSNSLDFDDLLFKTYELFVKRPEVADYYSNKFRYIHIDEFQDTNKVQFLLARRLSISHGNIFVVGDDDQSIYGWRGAKIENILSFDDLYKGAKIYKLERNYRSTKRILELANCIIANNTERRKKQLWTDNPDGVKVETFVGSDENNEASFVALQIKNLMARSTMNYSDFAVFMRVNAISRAFEQEFTKYNIPYRVFGGFKFFERKEIKDILSYLKLINNNYDDESFIRSIGCPKRGIGDKTIKDLYGFCADKGISLYKGLDYLEQTDIGGSAKIKLHNYKILIDSFMAYAQNHRVEEIIDYVIECTGFLEQFSDKSEENMSKIMNIDELKSSAEQFSKVNVGSTLADYLNSVTLSSDTDSMSSDDVVTIATIHASKGLEYKCVFVTGLDEKILPVGTAMYDDSELEEERRLMYVAITRAMERLYLTRATSRYMYGKRDYMLPSRFLNEAQSILSPNMPVKEAKKNYDFDKRNTYYDDDFGGSGGAAYSSGYAKTFLNASKPKENGNVNVNVYKTGVKVRHKKFGEGTVITVKGSGDSTVVDVAFERVGIKSLAIKFAPMEIV